MKKDESKIDKITKKDLGLRSFIAVFGLYFFITTVTLKNYFSYAETEKVKIPGETLKATGSNDQNESSKNEESKADEEEEAAEEVAEADEEEAEEDIDQKEYQDQSQEEDEEELPASEVANAQEVNQNQNSNQSPSQNTNPNPNSEQNLVDVIPGESSVVVLKHKNYEDYKIRRKTHGGSVNVTTENIYMADYTSLHDDEIYEALWGQEDVSLVQLGLNYKYNFTLGSLNLGIGYGHGSLLDDRIGDERTIALDKSSASIQFLLDNLMREPYFVPYVGASIFNFKINEYVKSTDQTYEMTSSYGNSFTVGFLIQLSWMERETSRLAYQENGIENTYLDVFWTQYENPNEDPDPSIQSDLNWGAGLRVEF